MTPKTLGSKYQRLQRCLPRVTPSHGQLSRSDYDSESEISGEKGSVCPTRTQVLLGDLREELTSCVFCLHTLIRNTPWIETKLRSVPEARTVCKACVHRSVLKISAVAFLTSVERRKEGREYTASPTGQRKRSSSTKFPT